MKALKDLLSFMWYSFDNFIPIYVETFKNVVKSGSFAFVTFSDRKLRTCEHTQHILDINFGCV